jgi:hypothetical protein
MGINEFHQGFEYYWNKVFDGIYDIFKKQIDVSADLCESEDRYGDININN